jgi:rubrerythrin
MRFKKTIDALNHVCLFHNSLSKYYQEISNVSKSEKVKLLLDYMAENEKLLAKRISDYQEQAASGNLNTWFQYANDTDILKLPVFGKHDLFIEPEDIAELSMKYSDELIQLYTEMSDYSDNIGLKEVFDNLADMQIQEKHKLSMNIDRLMDI